MMNEEEMPKRPRLPRELYEPSAPRAAAFVVVSALSFLGFGLLASQVARMQAPLWLRALVVGPLLLAAQQGAHLTGWVGHEGIHLNLHRNRYVSVIVGSFVSAMSFFAAIGYGVSHWNHHRFTNRDLDPDVAIYSRLKTFWSRFFLARILAQRGYMRALIRIALGKPLPLRHDFTFRPRMQRALAVLNIAFLLLWAGAYATLAMMDLLTALFAIVLPLVLVIPFSGLRIYTEHAGTHVGMFRDSRSYISRFYTLIFFGNNYHLEHHLYPSVPCYKLPAVHRLLKRQGCHVHWGSPVDPTILGPIVHTTATSQYPQPQQASCATVVIPRLDAYQRSDRERVGGGEPEVRHDA